MPMTFNTGDEVSVAFTASLNAMMEEVAVVETDHKFWDQESFLAERTRVRNLMLVEKLTLTSGEIHEAIDAMRNGNPRSQKIPEFSCVEEELADAFIRLIGTAKRFGARLPEAVLAKNEYNIGRPPMHGKEF